MYFIGGSNTYKSTFGKKKLFKSDGYFVCSVGEASLETIRNYITNQG